MNRHHRIRLSFIQRLATVLASLLLVVSMDAVRPASAQSDDPGELFGGVGVWLNRSLPTQLPGDYYVNDELDLRGRFRPSVGLAFDFSDTPLVLRDGDGAEFTLIERQMLATVGGGFVFADRFRFSGAVPLVNTIGATTPFEFERAGNRFLLAPESGWTLGDASLGLDVRLFGRYGAPFTAALGGVTVFLPTGSHPFYAGEGAVRVLPRLAMAGIGGMFQYALQFGYHLRPDSETFGDLIGPEVFYSAAMGLRFANGAVVLGPELWGASRVPAGDRGWFAADVSPMEAGGTLTINAAGFRFSVGGSSSIQQGLGSPGFRLFARVGVNPYFKPASNEGTVELEEDGRDRDGDGIPDRRDACPWQPGQPDDDNPSVHGCPYADDSDGDGIPDAEDACPHEAGEANTKERRWHGCKSSGQGQGSASDNTGVGDIELPTEVGAEPAQVDADGDGVSDLEDDCPATPGGGSDQPGKNGCPEDAVSTSTPSVDALLADLTKPAPSRDTSAEEPGEPVDDGARVACRDVAGQMFAGPGCPLAVLTNGQIETAGTVRFRRSGDMTDDGIAIVEAVAVLLREHPEVPHVTVEVHTDNRGRRKSNFRLSRQRAAVVVQWLRDAGVQRGRLTPKGFGPRYPIASNATPEGRALNRRVVFKIGKTPVTKGRSAKAGKRRKRRSAGRRGRRRR